MKRVLSVALLTVLGLTGCGGDTGPADVQKVTIVLDWTPNTNHSGIYLAQQSGIYREASLDVTIVEPDQSGSVAQVAAGNAQFGVSYAEEVLPRRAQGTPVVSIATVLRTNTSSLVSPTDRGIRRPRDLEGKRYAGYGGPLEKPLIEALVRCDGGDPSKVTFIDLGITDYAVGFRKRAFDVVWAFDGWDVVRLRDVNKQPVNTIALRDHHDCIPDWYTPVIVTTDSFLATQPDVVKRFLDATTRGYRIAAKSPRRTADAIAIAAPESDTALLDASARFLTPYFVDNAGRFGVQDPAVWENFAAFLRSRKLPVPDDIAESFTNDYLPKQ